MATPDSRPAWLRWLHRLGYVTTAIVVVQLLALGFVAGTEWLNQTQEIALPTQAEQDAVR